MTSHDMVDAVRRAAGVRRVGHAGTLDPAAAGVLLACVGPATRIVEHLRDLPKRYRVELALGVVTDSQDAQGEVTAAADASHVTAADLEAACSRFVGEIRQLPPMHSAVHHQGKRLYQYARRGQTVERQPRCVHIHEIELLEFVPGPVAQAWLDVTCSSGVYIRTLCHDLGAALGVGGMMAFLVRTAVGDFAVDGAVRLEELREALRDGRGLLPVSRALAHLPEVRCAPADVTRVRHGQPILADPDEIPIQTGTVRLSDDDGRVIALGRLVSDPPNLRWRPTKVLAPGDPVTTHE